MDSHYRALERMYALAPINRYYPNTLLVESGKATLNMEIDPEKHFHVLGSVHGSVCFKMLDDAAAFAALSTSDTQPMVTANFEINFKAPAAKGVLTAVCEVVKTDGRKVFVEGVLTDDNGQEIANGSGLFLPAKLTFDDVKAYQR